MQPSALAGQKIVALRVFLKMNQRELAERLGTSTMSLSRWERDQLQPPAAMLIKLGSLSHGSPTNCWDLWEMAGLSFQDVSRVLPSEMQRLRRALTVLQVVKAGATAKIKEDSLVAIPISSLIASAGAEDGSPSHNLRSAVSRHAIVAPKLWCPHPGDTICMRVSGNSMQPLLHSGYIIVVDQRQTERGKLHGQIIVAHHKKLGLVVSRFWRIDKTESLIPDNREHKPVPWSAAWSVTGKVLWWIGQPG